MRLILRVGSNEVGRLLQGTERIQKKEEKEMNWKKVLKEEEYEQHEEWTSNDGQATGNAHLTRYDGEWHWMIDVKRFPFGKEWKQKVW